MIGFIRIDNSIEGDGTPQILTAQQAVPQYVKDFGVSERTAKIELYSLLSEECPGIGNARVLYEAYFTSVKEVEPFNQ